MTTVNELIEILVSVKKWNGENPVIVLVDGKQMAVDQVIDVGYAGGNEAVILECRNESLRKVPRPCSYSDSQRKIQDEITERDLALIRSIRAGGEIPPQTSREILQIVALSPSVKPRSPELPAIGRRPYDGLNGEIILENSGISSTDRRYAGRAFTRKPSRIPEQESISVSDCGIVVSIG